MEPKLSQKVSPKLLTNEAKIDFKNQLKFEVVFYWFSVMFDTILTDFSTLKLKRCKSEKSEKNNLVFPMYFHDFRLYSMSKIDAKFVLKNEASKSHKKLILGVFLDTKIHDFRIVFAIFFK